MKKVELANEFNIFPICSDCWRRLEFSESRASAKLQMWYLLQQLWRWQIIKQANKCNWQTDRQTNKQTNSESRASAKLQMWSLALAAMMKMVIMFFFKSQNKPNKCSWWTNRKTNKQTAIHELVKMWSSLLRWWKKGLFDTNCVLFQTEQSNRTKQRKKQINRQTNKKRVMGRCKTTNVILAATYYDDRKTNQTNVTDKKQTNRQQMLSLLQLWWLDKDIHFLILFMLL